MRIALPDLQDGVRRALVTGDASPVVGVLVGGKDGGKRFAIHQRHYAVSLVTALLDRFPATVWLVGSEVVTEAARWFVQRHPPSRPCLAEYGESFPQFLAEQPAVAHLAYLRSFAELEWHVGRLALAVDHPVGVHYLHADWAIDELMSIYLTDCEPEQFVLEQGDFWLELCGNRGELRINRLGEADFRQRASGDRHG
jgi:hypothetical protein